MRYLSPLRSSISGGFITMKFPSRRTQTHENVRQQLRRLGILDVYRYFMRTRTPRTHPHRDEKVSQSNMGYW